MQARFRRSNGYFYFFLFLFFFLNSSTKDRLIFLEIYIYIYIWTNIFFLQFTITIRNNILYNIHLFPLYFIVIAIIGSDRETITQHLSIHKFYIFLSSLLIYYFKISHTFQSLFLFCETLLRRVIQSGSKIVWKIG